MNNILITGGLGFIGSHVVDLFRSKGYSVTVLDKKTGYSTSNYFNLTSLETKYDIIIHLGANCSSQLSLREPQEDFTDNALGTFNVIEYSRVNGNIPIIFTSTSKTIRGEDDLLTPYGISKLTGELYLQEFHKLYGMDYIINRPSSVFGPRQNANEDGGWLTWFIIASLKNVPVVLHGDGTQSRDMLYVDDYANLLLHQIEHFDWYKNDDYNVGGGSFNDVTLLEALEYLNYKNYTFADKFKGDIAKVAVDNTKIVGASHHEWIPTTIWKDGVDRTLSFFKTQYES